LTFVQLIASSSFPYLDDDEDSEPLYTLFLPHDQRPHGYVLLHIADKIPWPNEFSIDHERRRIQLQDTSNGENPSEACNAAFAKIIDESIERDLFQTIHGVHSELFAILGANYPVQIERFAAPLFGIISRGAHLTVYTNTVDGMKIWVPRRSPAVHTYPNMLDTTVAGGVPAKETPFETIIHEADEEASLPADILRRDTRACGVLTYISRSKGATGGEQGLIVPDTVHIFDLEVGKDIIPKPKDEEVKEFYLMSVEEVHKALLGGEFKTNSAVVMIDFFIRHGIITSENEKDYVEIVMRMHRRLPFPAASQ
jgi:8-oxo-dGTP pyrophosphatase MutT (NUDIX family)